MWFSCVYNILVCDLIALVSNCLCRNIVEKKDLEELPPIKINDERNKQLEFRAEDYCKYSMYVKITIDIYLK